jgi:GDP-mannose 6-dehydrogenase
MRIAVFGLGYVGSVTAACLAHLGHKVWGVDVSQRKVRMINRGKAPVMEKGLDDLVLRAVRNNRLMATHDFADAVERAEVCVIAVGTPSRRDGSVNLTEVRTVSEEIGRTLRRSNGFRTVELRSTVPPGTTSRVVIPLLERTSGKKAGRDFGVAFHPEFLREGSSVDDFFHPTRTVIGRREQASARALVRLWRPVRAPLILTSLETAETVKYADNSFHALKICFANEIGSLCLKLGLDPQEVMRIFVQDRRLNISPMYLRPGFAFGGPCLPKDVRALCAVARKSKTDAPLIKAILPSNSKHLKRAIDLVLATGKKKVGILGLVFKSDTDDLRESPACALTSALLRAGRRVKVYDPNVNLARLLGANRASIERELPSLPRLLVSSAKEILRDSEVIVVTRDHPGFRNWVRKLKAGQILVNLATSVSLRHGNG